MPRAQAIADERGKPVGVAGDGLGGNGADDRSTPGRSESEGIVNGERADENARRARLFDEGDVHGSSPASSGTFRLLSLGEWKVVDRDDRGWDVDESSCPAGGHADNRHVKGGSHASETGVVSVPEHASPADPGSTGSCDAHESGCFRLTAEELEAAGRLEEGDVLRANVEPLLLRCVNADPNYGSMWFHCRHRPSDTAK